MTFFQRIFCCWQEIETFVFSPTAYTLGDHPGKLSRQNSEAKLVRQNSEAKLNVGATGVNFINILHCKISSRESIRLVG